MAARKALICLTCLLMTACGSSDDDDKEAIQSSSSISISSIASSLSSNSSSNSSQNLSSNSISSLASSAIASSLSSSSSSDSSGLVRVDSGLSARANNTTCSAPAAPPSALGNYTFQDMTIPAGVDSPIYLIQAPGVDNRYYVVERPGRIRSFVLGESAATLAVDFSSQVITSGEGGALSMAFHPYFETNRYAYIFFTASKQTYGITTADVSMITVVRRYTVSNDGLTFSNPVDILAPINANDTRFNQVATNHKGGWIGFSPTDGYLYISLGDRGEGAGRAPLSNDFYNPAQDMNSLHGKILRIDVNSGSPYGIPQNNPFSNTGGAPEIFAWGFRNPWRASFDRLTGDLWVADVGETTLEEINLVELGGNYGWPFREGKMDRCDNCIKGQQSIAPVVDLPHDDGWVAIMGGYVYRGSAIPELQGRYIFGDYSRSNLTTISYDGNGEAYAEDIIINGSAAISYSEDNAGNIWRIRTNGKLQRLTQTAAPTAGNFPQTLSATGCFDPENVREPAAGVVPYDLNSPLWSDGAAKERYFAIPDGTQITIEANDQWSFPVGSVLIKTFLLQDKPIETRLLVRHESGEWGGYSYEWNDAGTDAQLLSAGKTKTVANQNWRFPSRAQCMNCHTAPNGSPAWERVLGLETAQINRDFIYPGNLIANQIQTLATVDYFASNPGSPSSLAEMPNPHDDNANLTDRARAYLHTNCSNCHQPNGSGRGNMDFRYLTNWITAGYCNQTPSFGNFGIANAHLLKPSAATESIIPVRMARSDAHRMPPLGVNLVDDEGVELIQDWINSLSECQ